MLNFSQAQFVKSASNLHELPEEQWPEVAFAGRSNAGKSSALNRLTRQKKLARTSKTPGRTQLLNVFGVGSASHIIDLPGYGFARASKQQRANWKQMVSDYLVGRQQLTGLVIVMDCRHPLTKLDQNMLNWCQESELPCHVLLTKADKLSRSKQNQTLFTVKKQMADFDPSISLQLFSADNGQGLEQLESQLRNWLTP